MRQKVAAFLLSALVFPGLGQIYKQDRRKGVILILVANLLFAIVILAAIILMSTEYFGVFYPRPLTGEIMRQLAEDTATHPLFLVPALLLVGLWAFAALDALRSRAPVSPEGS